MTEHPRNAADAPLDRAAWRFFHAQAMTPGRNAVTAADLARAEAAAAACGWDVLWMDDAEGAADWDCHDGCMPEHVEMAVLVQRYDADGSELDLDQAPVLASLGSIADADPAYRRVVAAELVSGFLAANGFSTNFPNPPALTTSSPCAVLSYQV